ncbi:MAG: hypothetical protein M3256_04440 [Actinomycetota bacterium]|nr:hypothetical protein [Actinomycetota bacterium]
MAKLSAESNKEAVTPDAITKVATGFMAAKHLFTASSVGLFAELAGGPLTLAQLAERCGIPARSARIFADAMVALGFLEKAEAGYANRPVAKSFLAGGPEEGLRPFLSFWDQISYPAWLSLEAATRSGRKACAQNIKKLAANWRPAGLANYFWSTFSIPRSRTEPAR